jgi:hypothetical protein
MALVCAAATTGLSIFLSHQPSMEHEFTSLPDSCFSATSGISLKNRLC